MATTTRRCWWWLLLFGMNCFYQMKVMGIAEQDIGDAEHVLLAANVFIRKLFLKWYRRGGMPWIIIKSSVLFCLIHLKVRVNCDFQDKFNYCQSRKWNSWIVLLSSSVEFPINIRASSSWYVCLSKDCFIQLTGIDSPAMNIFTMLYSWRSYEYKSILRFIVIPGSK